MDDCGFRFLCYRPFKSLRAGHLTGWIIMYNLLDKADKLIAE